jgi:4'-phosphopantetheinyl transferase
MMLNQRLYVDELVLTRPEQNFKANLCFCYLPSRYEEIVKFLHPKEREIYEALKFEKRIRSYLLGRYVAKHAIAALVGEQDLANILIQPGVFTQPVATCANNHNIQVGITHCDDFGAAVAFPEAHPMGIDIESISPNKKGVMESQMTETEKELIITFPFSYQEMLAFLWTMKEALSKALRTGLMTPFEIFEVNRIEVKNDCLVGYFKNFAQYKTVSFSLSSHYICSIVYPMKTNLNINIAALQNRFDFTSL